MNIFHILPSFHWLKIPSLYLYHVKPWVRKYHPSLPTPVHILTYSTYLWVLLHGNLTQNMLQPNCDLSTKLTHIPQNRTFILNGLLYIYKTSPHNTKKTSFTKLFWFDSPTSVNLFKYILKISDPSLSIGTGFGKPHSINILHQYPVWSDLILSNLWFTLTLYIHYSVHWMYPWIYFWAKDLVCLFILCTWSIMIYLQNISSVQLTVVGLVIGRF